MIEILSALTLTLLIEVPLGALILKRKDTIIPLILINTLTNPALNAALIILFSLTRSYAIYWIAVAVGEIAVFVGEGSLISALCDIPLKRSLLLSAVINACSLFLGGAISAIL